MSVLTISRECGSNGDEIAKIISGKTGYTLLERKTIEKLIDNEAFPDIHLEKFDEHSPGFRENFTNEKDIYLDRLRTAVFKTADNGKAVIVGRGAQFILSSVPGVFKVKIIASKDIRIQRAADFIKKDFKTAERYCRKIDHERNGFNKFFFGGAWEDPAVYHLIVSTDNFTAEETAEIIINAYKASPVYTKTDNRILKDKLTAQSIRNNILYKEKIPIDLLEVECKHGKVKIVGTVNSKLNIDRCTETALKTDGVISVDSEVFYIDPVITY